MITKYKWSFTFLVIFGILIFGFSTCSQQEEASPNTATSSFIVTVIDIMIMNDDYGHADTWIAVFSAKEKLELESDEPDLEPTYIIQTFKVRLSSRKQSGYLPEEKLDILTHSKLNKEPVLVRIEGERVEGKIAIHKVVDINFFYVRE